MDLPGDLHVTELLLTARDASMLYLGKSDSLVLHVNSLCHTDVTCCRNKV